MSSHPEDPFTPREPTQPMGAVDGAAGHRTAVDDPSHAVDLRDAPAGASPVGATPSAGAPHHGHGAHASGPTGASTGSHGDGQDPSPVDEAAHQLAQPDNQAKLLMAMAVVLFLTFLIALALLIDHLADGGEEPVIVDGVPCLIQEGAGEGEEAVLFCQR